MMHSMPKQDGDLLLGAEEVDGRELEGCQTFIIDQGARLCLVRAGCGAPGRRTCMWLALMSSGNNELMRRDGRT